MFRLRAIRYPWTRARSARSRPVRSLQQRSANDRTSANEASSILIALQSPATSMRIGGPPDPLMATEVQRLSPEARRSTDETDCAGRLFSARSRSDNDARKRPVLL